MQILHRKERVVLAAIDIINEEGIQGLSTKKIATRQGISEGTLFKHFRSKNEIISAVLDYFSQYDKDIYESCLLKKLKPKESLRFIIDSYATYYENYPAITAILQIYESLTYNKELAGKVYQTIHYRSQIIRQFIEAGQSNGEFDASIDSTILLDIIVGAFRNICLTWRMSNFEFSLRNQLLSMLTVVFTAFGKKTT